MFPLRRCLDAQVLHERELQEKGETEEMVCDVKCAGEVKRTYAGPTGRCWGSGSWGTDPEVCPGDSGPS